MRCHAYEFSPSCIALSAWTASACLMASRYVWSILSRRLATDYTACDNYMLAQPVTIYRFLSNQFVSTELQNTSPAMLESCWPGHTLKQAYST